jgi:hypothetical protein
MLERKAETEPDPLRREGLLKAAEGLRSFKQKAVPRNSSPEQAYVLENQRKWARIAAEAEGNLPQRPVAPSPEGKPAAVPKGRPADRAQPLRPPDHSAIRTSDYPHGRSLVREPERHVPTTADVISDFGALLEKQTLALTDIADASLLPHPKEKILEAILAAVRVTRDRTLLNHLEAGAMFLAQYQAGVGERVSANCHSTT